MQIKIMINRQMQNKSLDISAKNEQNLSDKKVKSNNDNRYKLLNDFEMSESDNFKSDNSYKSYYGGMNIVSLEDEYHIDFSEKLSHFIDKFKENSTSSSNVSNSPIRNKYQVVNELYQDEKRILFREVLVYRL